MDIICNACGGDLKVPDWVDTVDYEGQISCTRCRTIWDVIIKRNKLGYFHPSGLFMMETWGIPAAFLLDDWSR